MFPKSNRYKLTTSPQRDPNSHIYDAKEVKTATRLLVSFSKKAVCIPSKVSLTAISESTVITLAS